jgi:hypothetical protein
MTTSFPVPALQPRRSVAYPRQKAVVERSLRGTLVRRRTAGTSRSGSSDDAPHRADLARIERACAYPQLAWKLDSRMMRQLPF